MPNKSQISHVLNPRNLRKGIYIYILWFSVESEARLNCVFSFNQSLFTNTENRPNQICRNVWEIFKVRNSSKSTLEPSFRATALCMWIVFHADSDFDRVEAKFCQKWFQIDDFRFSLPKRVFSEVFRARSGGRSGESGRPASWPAGWPTRRSAVSGKELLQQR